MRATYERLQQLFIRKGREAMAQINLGQQWSHHLLRSIEKLRESIPRMRVTHCDRQAEVFTVDELADVTVVRGWLPVANSRGMRRPTTPPAAPTTLPASTAASGPLDFFPTTYVHTKTPGRSKFTDLGVEKPSAGPRWGGIEINSIPVPDGADITGGVRSGSGRRERKERKDHNKPKRPLLEPMNTHHMEPCVRI
ncbi:hypothetical protein PIB30_012636 [Stylosanthes scabra]|uniref:Uncharacterized protein n=1 Tax=Stylosanthes scabra TaxID=79078 RepID=A0ABU6Y3C6_9FABA|nr:hypothetical protein [Stylosanthes scabra]